MQPQQLNQIESKKKQLQIKNAHKLEKCRWPTWRMINVINVQWGRETMTECANYTLQRWQREGVKGRRLIAEPAVNQNGILIMQLLCNATN